MVGHGEPHLGGDVHVDVLIQPLPSTGDEIVEPQELLHERVNGALVADHVHGVSERRSEHHRFGELGLLHEPFLGQLRRADPTQLVRRRIPDTVADVTGDVAKQDRLVRPAHLAPTVVPRLAQTVERLVRKVDRLGRQRLRPFHPQADDGERAEAQEACRRLGLVRNRIAEQIDQRRQRDRVHDAIAGDPLLRRPRGGKGVPLLLGPGGEQRELTVEIGARDLPVSDRDDAIAVDFDGRR